MTECLLVIFGSVIATVYGLYRIDRASNRRDKYKLHTEGRAWLKEERAKVRYCVKVTTVDEVLIGKPFKPSYYLGYCFSRYINRSTSLGKAQSEAQDIFGRKSYQHSPMGAWIPVEQILKVEIIEGK